MRGAKGPAHLAHRPSAGNGQSSSDCASEPKFHFMKAMPPSFSAVDLNLVDSPRKASPGDSCAHAPWSHPAIDEANSYIKHLSVLNLHHWAGTQSCCQEMMRGD